MGFVETIFYARFERPVEIKTGHYMSDDKLLHEGDAQERTIKTAGQIVKYSREIYHLESVEEVANLTLEATPHFIDGHPTPTLFEIRDGAVRMLASMAVDADNEEGTDSLANTAYETQSVVVCAGPGTEFAYQSEDLQFVSPSEYERDTDGTVTVAAPTVYTDDAGDSGAVLLVRWRSLPTVEMYHVKPVDYLAEHVATAIVNIRSRERLERARNDLARRKEMLEVYDTLLRHDIGNDLQVINGFTEVALAEMDTESPAYEHIERVYRTGQDAAALINAVGETIKTLQEEDEPERQSLSAILTASVENVRMKFDSLEVKYQPSAFAYDVYAGDLAESVFTNILSNAAVHNDDEVTVWLSAEDSKYGHVTVTIEDDGCGVNDGLDETLFQMGKKGPHSDGTGLGLGLARTLITAYGGSIELTDSQYGGAAFEITLKTA